MFTLPKLPYGYAALESDRTRIVGVPAISAAHA